MKPKQLGVALNTDSVSVEYIVAPSSQAFCSANMKPMVNPFNMSLEQKPTDKEDTAPQQIFPEETADVVCPRPPESSDVEEDPKAREANTESQHTPPKSSHGMPKKAAPLWREYQLHPFFLCCAIVN
ncbi:unnamed protein product [Timema podura]|uniref:Uncharacterized protein n=1 Tax=Timema podura TaxID=61482 RepID=A0ABN7P8B2_TIMPD|nr:unnamed protein product [Timema podura]